MCIACNGQSTKYSIKAEKTTQYVERIQLLMQEQRMMTKIDRKFDSETAKKYPNGFVKVCATWVQTMWGITPDKNPDTVSEFKGLNEPTMMFDSCGAYDVYNDNAAIRKGSTFPKW